MGRGKIRRWALGLSVAVGLIGLVGASPAAAATQLGETVSNPEPCASSTSLQSGSPGNSYAAPTGGVITEWGFQAGPTPPAQLRLKIGRPLGGNNFAIVGESTFVAPAAGVLSSFPTRISVQAGDVLGLFTPSSANICRATAPADGFANHHSGNPGPDVPVGTTMTFFGPFNSPQLDVSARLELDTDNDGFGDETQDCAPTDPSRAEDCKPPDTTITTGPPKKTRKKVATFGFTGTEPLRAIARLECSLDGAEFVPCTSPRSFRVKRGRHTFSVRAADELNNLDASPATYSWKVKKKKKKK